jgi:sulfate permease, SulP family
MASPGRWSRSASWLRTELQPRRLIPTLTAGVVIGILEVVLASSFAALIFGGRGSVHLPEAIGFSLFGATAVLLVIAFFSSLPGMVGSLQDTTAAILALLATSITAKLALDLGYTEQQVTTLSSTFLTVVTAVIVASALTGISFLVLGSFKLGRLVRFVPYSVIGGFLAGTGWLLVKGGIGVLTQRSLTLASIDVFGRPAVLLRWLPGVLFAAVLLGLVRRFRHFLTIPAVLIAGVAAFYVVLGATGTTVDAAEARGWLLGPFPPGGGLFDPVLAEAFTYADWGAILGQSPSILTLVLVAVLALLINATGIELVANRETDVNRELQVAGLATVIGSAGGGIVGFQALTLTALARRTGTTSRLVGVVAASVCLAALAFGARALSLFPRPVLGGLVVFLGLSFLVEWVLEARSKVLRRDYVVILLILLSVAVLGFLQGVVVGLLLATMLFVVDYSRIDVVKDDISGSVYRSKVEREPEHLEILRREGDRIHVLALQGIVFFGTANSLLDRIRGRAEDPSALGLQFLVVDFRRVFSLDSSAVLAFLKTHQLAVSRGFTLILTGLSGPVRHQLVQGGLDIDGLPEVRLFPELDRGVEWCEDRLLEDRVEPQPEPAERLPALLRDGLGGSVDPERLMRYLEVQEIDAGYELIRQGDSSDDLFFLESGRLTAQLRRPDGEAVRLQTMGPGTLVGEVSLYQGTARTASVVSEAPSRLRRLTREGLADMERDDPELAAALHRLIARLLASRLADTQSTVRALLE